MTKSKSTPVTVLTGFLGAGKTTMILSILKQLKPDYKVCLLKNEFGDVEVDSLLTDSPSISGVEEILNGCLCCVMVGQMKNALLEIKEKFNPDRIIVESSGSAFPATLAWQIRELERETAGGLTLDAVLTVIDCINFTGYEDTSPTAKMQAKYTDIIILNKWDLVNDRQLDNVLDHLYTLNDETPKLRHSEADPLTPSVLFGLDSKLFLERETEEAEFKAAGWQEGNSSHNAEVETFGVFRGGDRSAWPKPKSTTGKAHVHSADSGCCVKSESSEAFLDTLPSSIYRVKGLLNVVAPTAEGASSANITPFSAQPLPPSTESSPADPTETTAQRQPTTTTGRGIYILNWAFGRYTLTALPAASKGTYKGVQARLTLMGERGEVRKWASRMGEVVHGVFL
ncbi:Cobalamin synthesis protein [Phaffia rhodozyma]|uniref:Cobalamin synthesis protein n=1 Tax=Phaffia rhodozyma TaxID=264483 RepID=A0A0F7SFF7_PHARH|nr:Cobalamin synthesis protein [Phaffia rhodozyma]